MLGRVTLLVMYKSRIRGELDSTLHSEPFNESQDQDKLHKPPPGCLDDRQRVLTVNSRPFTRGRGLSDTGLINSSIGIKRARKQKSNLIVRRIREVSHGSAFRARNAPHILCCKTMEHIAKTSATPSRLEYAQIALLLSQLAGYCQSSIPTVGMCS